MIKTKVIEQDRNGDTLEVIEDYEECGINVPVGFRSDGISVPRILWRLLSPCITSSSVTAGVVHDYIYRKLRDTVSRSTADDIFYHLLVKYGFGKVRASIAWLGVRLFGWVAWRRNENATCNGCSVNCKHCYRYTKCDSDGDDK